MSRVISVFLPTLSTDRVRRKAGDTAPPPEAPLILVGRDGRRRVVLAADVAAQSAGLRVGMPASKAQALVQGLVIKDADPIADAEALERLAFWMLQHVAPIVAADPPDGVVIDSTGADHLHGGEAATLAILVREARRRWPTRLRGHRRHLGSGPCPCPLRPTAGLHLRAGERGARRRAFADRSSAASRRDGPRSSCPRL
jgi:nucleotidyltransferase/DNA polymerase involved in DNA repair